MKRILLLMLITLTLLSITAVSAEDNATLISDEIAVDDEPLAQDTPDEIIGNDIYALAGSYYDCDIFAEGSYGTN